MRRLFSLFSILSLVVTPAWAAAPQDKKLQMSVVSKPRPLFSKPPPLACSVTDVEMLEGKSQINLMKLFENVACSGVGEVISSESLDLNYCKALSKCSDTQVSQTNINASDRRFLENEASVFLLRENAQKEMDRYTTLKAESVKDLASFVGKMAPRFKSKVVQCESFSNNSVNSCLIGDPVKTKVVQLYIATAYDKKLKKSASSLEKPSFDNQLVDNLGTARSQQSNEQSLAQSFKVISVENDFNFNQFLKDLQNKEAEATHYIRTHSNLMDAENDVVLRNVNLEVIKRNNDVLKISDEEIKDIVRKSLHKSTQTSNDFIFTYNNKDSEAIINKAISELNFGAKDFNFANDAGKKALSDKLNEIRVRLANSHFASECPKVNTSIDQVCSNIFKKIEKGTALDLLYENKEDPLSKMIDFYQNNNVDKKDEIIAKLTKMKGAPGNVYQKYLSFFLQVDICEDKFASELKSKSDRRNGSSKLEEKMKEIEAEFKTSRAETIATINETARKSASFKAEMNNLGIKVPEYAKKEMINSVEIPAHTAKVDGAINKNDDFMSQTKNYFSDQTAAQNMKVTKPFEPTYNDSIENFKAIDERKKANEPTEYETKLKAKLAELESKEKAISKKIAQNNSDSKDAEKSEELDQLSDLKRQIEDLKKSQVTAAANKAAQAGAVSAENNSAAKAQSQNNGSASTSVGFGSKASTSDVEVADSKSAGSASVANNSQSVEQSSNSAASRSVASTGPSGLSSNKTGAEKSFSGLVLSKTGEVLQDPASIVDNPKEGEIASMLEVTNGQPFLIRENGVLMKVLVELDSNGKPQLTKGKIRYKKERLSKEQQQVIVKDTNIQKSLKEVDRDPARLFNLKSLIKKSVKRE